jgi:hypothetical protein
VGKSFSTHVRVRNAYRASDGKPERRRPLGDLSVDGKML